VFEHDLGAAYMRVIGESEGEPNLKRGRTERGQKLQQEHKQQQPRKFLPRAWWRDKQSPRHGATVKLELRGGNTLSKIFFDGQSHWSDSAAREAAARAALEFFARHAVGGVPGVRFDNWGSCECGRVPPRLASEGGAEISLFGDVPLGQQRVNFILAALEEHGIRSFADVGCGRKARLVATALIEKPGQFERIVGVEPDEESVEDAVKALDNLPVRHFSSGTWVDIRRGTAEAPDAIFASGNPNRIALDAVVMQEVVEHMDPDPLRRLGSAILGGIRPKLLLVTTPNREVNPLLYYAHRALEEEAIMPMLVSEGSEEAVQSPSFDSHYDPSAMRDPDHRFEWSVAEFSAWAHDLASAWGYRVEFRGVGTLHPRLFAKAVERAGGAIGGDQGAATQAALFTRIEEVAADRALQPLEPLSPNAWPLAKEWIDTLALRRENKVLMDENVRLRSASHIHGAT